MPNLTKRGARNVTADLDRVATLFQNKFETLGVPKKVALDFAYRCDLLADHIERNAVRLAGEEKPEEEKTDEKPEDGKEAKGKKAGEDEEKPAAKDEKPEEDKAAKKKAADGSVEPAPGNQGFNANEIAEQVSGPEILPPVEPWMNGQFTQNWFQELRDLQEAGALSNAAAKGAIITKSAVDARLARLRRMASVSQLSVLQDVLKALQARLSASGIAEVKALAGEVGKQVAAVGKVRDMQIEQQVAGPADPLVLLAADRISQVLSEEIPALKGVAVAVDADSPMAVLEAQKSVESLKDLVSLSTSMINDAVKGTSKSESKEASKKAGEDKKPEVVEKPEEDKSAKKKAGEDVKDEKPEEDKAAKKKAGEDEDEEKEDAEKTASDDFGYNLSVA